MTQVPDRTRFCALARLVLWEALIGVRHGSFTSPCSYLAAARWNPGDQAARDKERPRPQRGIRALLFVCLAAVLGAGFPARAHAFKLHMPCTSSHDCPRGAFCRHDTSFRGQCVPSPQVPFGIFGERQIELPPQSDPPEHLSGSMPILRCSQTDPCPQGFVCAKYGPSKLQESLCVPSSDPCWSTADCSPGDMCDKPDDEFSLTGVCRPRTDAEQAF